MRTIAVCVLGVFCVVALERWAGAQSAQQGKFGGRQYKRIHQGLIDQITAGQTAKAAQQLTEYADEFPEDAETQYMLAVALGQLGERDEALAATRAALDAGLSPGRFVAGPRDLLQPLADTELYKRLAEENQIVHGPMVGAVTHRSAKFWVRTSRETLVKVYVQKADEHGKLLDPTSGRTHDRDDFTGVVEATGLQPDTDYRYTVLVTDPEDRHDKPANAGGTFRTAPAPGKPSKFKLAFGGGAGFVPNNERMWTTILNRKPQLLLMLGDNVYIDRPTSPHRSRYTYYRRQSRPEWRKLVAHAPTFSIWDDHDFGTNDCSGGPAIDKPAWKPLVWRIFTQNWVNPPYGGGPRQPGCWYKFSWGDVDFVMLDCRYYRTGRGKEDGTMLGPVQKAWLKETLKECRGTFKVLCSSVPWDFRTKGDSKDTWNGFRNEREEIFSLIEKNEIEGVVLMSADRHRSDAWRIERPSGYDFYEFNSSRLTNQAAHGTKAEAIFSYNARQSFGLVTFDTTAADPTVTYEVVTIDGETVHALPLRRSDLSFK